MRERKKKGRSAVLGLKALVAGSYAKWVVMSSRGRTRLFVLVTALRRELDSAYSAVAASLTIIEHSALIALHIMPAK